MQCGLQNLEYPDHQCAGTSPPLAPSGTSQPAEGPCDGPQPSSPGLCAATGSRTAALCTSQKDRGQGGQADAQLVLMRTDGRGWSSAKSHRVLTPDLQHPGRAGDAAADMGSPGAFSMVAAGSAPPQALSETGRCPQLPASVHPGPAAVQSGQEALVPD